MKLRVHIRGEDPLLIDVADLKDASEKWALLRQRSDLTPEEIVSVTLKRGDHQIASVSWDGRLYSVPRHDLGFASSDAELIYPTED